MLPRVIVHNVVSLDGRIDGFNPDVGLFYELASRWNEDATLVGSDTILQSGDPIPEEDEIAFQAPARDPADRRPLLVIPDSRGRVRSWHALRQQPYWRGTVALCSRATPIEYLEYLARRHVACILAGDNRVDLRAGLEVLAEHFGIRVLRVDSGGLLNAALLRAGLVHEVSLLIHPALAGGPDPRSLFRAMDLAHLEEAIPLRLTHLERMPGGEVWLRYEVVSRRSTGPG